MDAGAEDCMSCPACGGAGGGPFGRAGSAWDDEDFVCPRCKGVGVVALDDVAALPRAAPGLVKAQVQAAIDDAKANKKTG